MAEETCDERRRNIELFQKECLKHSVPENVIITTEEFINERENYLLKIAKSILYLKKSYKTQQEEKQKYKDKQAIKRKYPKVRPPAPIKVNGTNLNVENESLSSFEHITLETEITEITEITETEETIETTTTTEDLEWVKL